jgi:predicted O-linked N-acetylglucosamine transferase (SPINDLY family)
MLPIFEGLDRTLFEVRAYAVAGQKEDALTARIRQSVEAFLTLPDDVANAAEMLAREELDMLVYPDIGMHPFTYFLAFWRLAPIQCVCPGHPDTTGIDSIDYYLSDGDAEPPDAEAQYSERLVRIPGFYLPLFELPAGKAAAAPNRAHTYICSQTIVKLHPDFDPLLAGILAQDRRAEIVLYGDAIGSAGVVVAQRLKSRLGSLTDRLRMIPRQLYEDYLDTVRSAAVVLDTPHFGGGHTTLEALSMHVPVITRRGEFLRGRFAATRLSSLGLEECVAQDAAAYVDTAVEIANSPRRRARVVDVLHHRSATLLAPARPAASFNAALVRLLAGCDRVSR